MVHSEKGELIMESVDKPTLLTTLGPKCLPSGDLPEEALMGPMAELHAESWVHSAALPTVHQAGCPGNLAAYRG